MSLFLGVDGGQSSTTALIASESGVVLGRGADGPCNHVESAAEGREKFFRVIGGCVRAAAREAGLVDAIPPFRAACLGFSGGPADKEGILQEMLTAADLLVTTDAAIALAGACGGGPGIITIAGTGHISMGRGPTGQLARAGGWGYLFGDEGGGFWIACQGVRAAMRVHEGWGPATTLHEKLLEATGHSDANVMMHALYTAAWPRKRIAALSRIVDVEAEAGDSAAIDILQRGAAELFTISNAVRGNLFGPAEEARLSPIGSTWKSRILSETFTGLWIASHPRNRFAPPALGPAAGALLEAFRLAGIHPDLQNLPETEK
ncbi:MAG TPA: BadF/BadG/BcrA/BcrD ATPase family protein [Bryobacteraceae bacterium]|nr:BadF/BadG/BcrA/BcrD ATPase family protein [Bryobacteraceae bacterium]